MSNPIDRGFYCTTVVATRKCYRMTNGIWVRRYVSAGTTTLHIVLHRDSKTIEKLKDCSKCKHKLACLVNPECDRVFEGK